MPGRFVVRSSSTSKIRSARTFFAAAFKEKDYIRISVKTEEDGKKHLFFDAGKEHAEVPGEQPQLAQAGSDAT